jgi:1,4-alpha-glucan branching enzyme
MNDALWHAKEADVAAIIGARHTDPFAILGLHRVDAGFVIRALVPDAERVAALDRDDKIIIDLERRDRGDFFEGLVKIPTERFSYRLHAENSGGSWIFHDPYAHGPVLGPMDDYLLVEGTHQRLYNRLGAHLMIHEDVEGTLFAVWAPNARRVSVVGDFNHWDGRRHQMRKRVDSGIWEIFAPGVGEGINYKYEIIGADGALLPLKADPFGFWAELRPSTASVIARTDNFEWHDSDHMTARAASAAHRAPIAIYEVHLGSWRRGAGNRFLSYEELADTLIPYVADLGFTHIELMPINEHPLDASWGYQPIGLFAPTRRFGDPAGFARFVDRAHQAGLGVIIDWVPAHFPTDVHGLARFDGTALYEHADPRRG